MSGHQRIQVLPKDANIIYEQFSDHMKNGTVALGHIMLDDEPFSYREVDWSDEKEMAANIAANKGAGEWENDSLREMLLQLDSANFDLSLTMFDNHEIETTLGLKDDKKKDKEKSGKKREVVCPECDCHFEAN